MPPANLRLSEEAFRRTVEPHRHALQLHCYRMVGSLHDAEDLVQETMLRAWRGLDKFQGRSSLRSWLYRIATNACLDALSQRTKTRRFLPEDLSAPSRKMPSGPASHEVPWIEPYPDLALEGIVDATPGPAAQYEVREAVRLAFIAATQRLPAKQRAVLLLRDVLGWSASETAGALKMTVASANSALQRARSTLDKGLARDEISEGAGGGEHKAIAAQYASAWERKDLDGLVNLLARDATLVMPPWRLWYSGRANIRALFGWAWQALAKRGTYRMVPTHANSQVAFGTYLRRPNESNYQAHVFQVLTFRKGKISRITFFVETRFFPNFRLAPQLEA